MRYSVMEGAGYKHRQILLQILRFCSRPIDMWRTSHVFFFVLCIVIDRFPSLFIYLVSWLTATFTWPLFLSSPREQNYRNKMIKIIVKIVYALIGSTWIPSHVNWPCLDRYLFHLPKLKLYFNWTNASAACKKRRTTIVMNKFIIVCDLSWTAKPTTDWSFFLQFQDFF